MSLEKCPSCGKRVPTEKRGWENTKVGSGRYMPTVMTQHSVKGGKMCPGSGMGTGDKNETETQAQLQDGN